ncbi:MAG: hypothetical protein QM499_06430 [Flavobacteriaceae bacterium]
MENNKHKNNGLGLPENYFENFEERLFSKISEDIIPKKTGFSIPEDYFNTLESNVINQINTADKEVKVISIISKKTILYAASIAAITILAFSIFSNKPATTINDLDIASIENYIENGNIDLNTYELTSLLNDNDFDDLTAENEFITEEQLENYLLENIDDTSILTE